MKYTRLIPAIALLVVAVGACKKKDNDDRSAKTKMLYGSWKESYVVIDDNHNNVMDSDEYIALNTDHLWTFAKGGTGDIACGNDTQCTPATIKWALKDGETNLEVITTNTSSPTTSLIPITSLTADKLIYSVGDTDLFWVVFEKQ